MRTFNEDGKQNGWTKTVNRLTDGPTAAAIKPYGAMILILVGRKTWGYQKDWAVISYSEFEHCLGMNRRTVAKHLALLQGRAWGPRDGERVESKFTEANAPLRSRTAATSRDWGAVDRTQIEYNLNPEYDDEIGLADGGVSSTPREGV